MIGSFWNLCRACPSMPVDKLHSEYRSTYRWHEYTGGSRPEVIRRPPIANQFGTVNEPPLPRRKKCPELAYRTNEFISSEQQTGIGGQKNDIAPINRARSEERGGTPSRRSKSEGPHRMPNGHAHPVSNHVDGVDGGKLNAVTGKAGESSGLFKKTITKLSTEYRIQFTWPYSRKDNKDNIDATTVDAVDFPKKSQSMDALKSHHQSHAMPTVHKKRNIHDKATVQELEPLVNDNTFADEKHEKPIKSARPYSQHGEVRFKQTITDKENFGFIDVDKLKLDNKILMNGTATDHNNEAWYKEVKELRKKAGEYKNRGWGTDIQQPEVTHKQKELWEQVSRRSSLSALSLADSSNHRPITKEEKEKENNKKSSPTKVSKGYHAHFADNKLIFDGTTTIPGRPISIRHHLERTTGPGILDLEDGALLPSPTREKLMPAIPKSKDDESYSSQRGSPKKTATSRHGSPQKGSPKKIISPKKTDKQGKPRQPGNKFRRYRGLTRSSHPTPGGRAPNSELIVRTRRSQSVGPSSVSIDRTDGSPKRQIRAGSALPPTTKKEKKAVGSTSIAGERRPRPTTLSTSNHNRTKSSSVPPSGGRTIITTNQITNQIDNQTLSSPSTLTIPNLRTKSHKSPIKNRHQRPKSTILCGQTNDPMTTSTIFFDQPSTVNKFGGPLIGLKTMENEDDTDRDGGTSISSASPLPPHEVIPEHIVKSPPEPTRVKSPEQIIMRSPDPVNWTVPLDTGKTFTVTQNVRDGDSIIRPHSELKVSTPSGDKPPPAPMSAPPELSEQAKMEARPDSKVDTDAKSQNESSSDSVPTVEPMIRYDKPVPGSTLRCLDDPTFDPEINSPSTAARTVATDVLEKARDRFDRFWGGNKEENV